MNASLLHKPHRPFESLRAKDVMTPNPVSVRRDASIREVLELLTERGFGAAPVIDEKGRPIGVVSRTDILLHERECARLACAPQPRRSGYDCTEWDMFPEPDWSKELSFEVTDAITVGEIMTPTIFTVPLDMPAREVVRRMLELKVHHLFVSDNHNNLVGVISPLDVMRCLAD